MPAGCSTGPGAPRWSRTAGSLSAVSEAFARTGDVAGEMGLPSRSEHFFRNSPALPMAADLIAPYAPVVEINVESLPTAGEVATWTSEQFVSALAHDQTCPAYNPQFRQFFHVSFKVAAKMGPRFLEALGAIVRSSPAA